MLCSQDPLIYLFCCLVREFEIWCTALFFSFVQSVQVSMLRKFSIKMWCSQCGMLAGKRNWGPCGGIILIIPMAWCVINASTEKHIPACTHVFIRKNQLKPRVLDSGLPYMVYSILFLFLVLCNINYNDYFLSFALMSYNPLVWGS